MDSPHTHQRRRTPGAQTFRIYREPLVSATLASTFFLKGVSFLCIPFMTIFLVKDTTLPAYAIGILVGINQVGSLCSGFFGGVLADRIGKRRVLLIGLYVTAAVFFGFFVLASTMRGSIAFAPLFGLLNVLYGVMSAFFWPLSQVIMADSLPKEDRGIVFRHRYVVTSFASGVGPPVGAFLGIASDRAAFVVAGLCYAAFATVFWLLTRNLELPSAAGAERHGFGEAMRVLARDRTFTYLTLSMILFATAFAQIGTNLSRLVVHDYAHGLAFFSLLLTVNAIGIFALQPAATVFMRRVSPGQGMAIGNLILTAACLLFPAHDFGKAGLVGLIVAISVAEVLVVPTASVIVDELAPSSMRGAYYGAATLRNLGLAVGPAAGGFVLGAFAPGTLYTFMGICGAGATVAAWLALRTRTAPALEGAPASASEVQPGRHVA
jgi:predicted MFS family arabinose efflux permease